MSPRESSGASKSQKAAFSKTLKNHQFFCVFGSRGFPREPQETQEGSQEEPKVPKSGPKSDQIVGQKWHQKLSRMKPESWSKKGSTFKKIALTGSTF